MVLHLFSSLDFGTESRIRSDYIFFEKTYFKYSRKVVSSFYFRKFWLFVYPVASNLRGENIISLSTVLHQLDQKIIYPHYDFKHLTEKYFEIGMKLDDFLIQLVKYCIYIRRLRAWRPWSNSIRSTLAYWASYNHSQSQTKRASPWKRGNSWQGLHRTCARRSIEDQQSCPCSSNWRYVQGKICGCCSHSRKGRESYCSSRDCRSADYHWPPIRFSGIHLRNGRSRGCKKVN